LAPDPRFRFSRSDFSLFDSVLVEVLHGFRIPNFEKVLGADKQTFTRLFGDVRGVSPDHDLMLDEIDVLRIRNAIRETLRELGEEEFQTRTGYDFEEGEQTLERLDKLLSSRSSERD
jgi:hypothetical protein